MARTLLKSGTILVVLLTCVTTLAQNAMERLAQSTPEQRAQMQTSMMQEKLGLSAEQLTAVSKINLDIANQMQPIIESTEGPLMKLRSARDVEAQRDAALEKVLQPEQYQQWLAVKEEIKQRVEAKVTEMQGAATPPATN